MIETLNNRLDENCFDLSEIGLIIVDEAHYNYFRKIFRYFQNCNLDCQFLCPCVPLPSQFFTGAALPFVLKYPIQTSFFSAKDCVWRKLKQFG